MPMGFRASVKLISTSTHVPLVPHLILFPTLLAAVPDLGTNNFFFLKCKSSPTLIHRFPHSQFPNLTLLSPQILSSLQDFLHPTIQRSLNSSTRHSSTPPLPQKLLHPSAPAFWMLSCIQSSSYLPFGMVRLSPWERNFGRKIPNLTFTCLSTLVSLLCEKNPPLSFCWGWSGALVMTKSWWRYSLHLLAGRAIGNIAHQQKSSNYRLQGGRIQLTGPSKWTKRHLYLKP